MRGPSTCLHLCEEPAYKQDVGLCHQAPSQQDTGALLRAPPLLTPSTASSSLRGPPWPPSTCHTGAGERRRPGAGEPSGLCPSGSLALTLALCQADQDRPLVS